MARVKRGYTARRRRKAMLKRAKGFVGGRSRLYKTAKETVLRGLNYAYRDRRVRKRAFRALWIVRINAACRENGITYSRFANGLAKAEVTLNRKMLAHLALEDPQAFVAIVEKVKAAIAD